MALKATLTKAEFTALAEPLQEHYKANGDTYLLDAEGVEDVVGLKSALEKERTDRKAANAALAKYKDIDPVKYQEAVEKLATLDREKLEGKGAWDALEAQLIEKHTAALKPLNDRIGSLTSALEQKLIDAEAVTAIAAAKGRAKLLLPHVKSQIKVFEEDGQFVAKVVDASGNPRISDAKGAPMTISQLVEEMKGMDDFAGGFDASGAGGSGARPGTGGNGNGSIKLSREAVKNNPALYEAAKAKAATSGATIEFDSPA